MSIDSLPSVSEAQIRAMQRDADKLMKAEGIVIEPEKSPEVSASVETQEQNHVFPDNPPSAPEVSSATSEQPEEEVVQEVAAPTKQSAPAESFRALREKAERAERERDEALRYVKEIQSRKQEPQRNEPEVEESDLAISDEDLVEGKHINKIRKELYALRQESRQRQQQSTEMAVEAKLKAQYPDFDKVVSVDNLKDLSFAFPELANSIHANQDMYSKAVAAYTAIKKLGISQQDSLQSDKDRALKNAAKPRPLASVSPQQGESPLTKANAFAQGLTDDLKTQLRREMENARRNM